MKIVFLSLFLAISLFSVELDTNNSTKTDDKILISQIIEQNTTKSIDINITDDLNQSKVENNDTFEALDNNFTQKDIYDIYLKYSKYPDKIYTNQVFKVKITAFILSKNTTFNSFTTTAYGEENVTLLTKKIIWKNVDTKKYETYLSFKAHNNEFKLPIIKLSLENFNIQTNAITVLPPKIKFSKIALNDKSFSNLIAQDLKIKNKKSVQYDNQNMLLSFYLESKTANLRDFELKQFSNYEQGIKSVVSYSNKFSAHYYAIIPLFVKKIDFSYFNSTTKKFVQISLPITIEEVLISTQGNLNPKKDNKFIFKDLIIILILTFLFVRYMLKRNLKRFIMFIVPTLYFMSFFLPPETLQLEKGTKIYILPTSNSTLSKILNMSKETTVLYKKDKYTKILFKNQTTGWIKNDDNR